MLLPCREGDSDAPWLSSPWKPSCVPQNLSGSSSLSSRLLGSDSRDPQPSREFRVGSPHPWLWDPSPSPAAVGLPPQCLGPFTLCCGSTTECYGTPTQCLGPPPPRGARGPP